MESFEEMKLKAQKEAREAREKYKEEAKLAGGDVSSTPGAEEIPAEWRADAAKSIQSVQGAIGAVITGGEIDDVTGSISALEIKTPLGEELQLLFLVSLDGRYLVTLFNPKIPMELPPELKKLEEAAKAQNLPAQLKIIR